MFENNDFILELLSIISNSILPIVRILATISHSPIFGENLVERKLKIILSLFISYVSLSFFFKEERVSFSEVNFINILEQYLIGMLIGLSFKIIFVLANIAGELISLQIGLSFSTFFDFYNRSDSSTLSYILNILMLLVFLLLNGHLWIIIIILKSFQWIPISHYIDYNIFYVVVNFLSFILFKGVILALPIVLVILILNILTALLTRAIPQLSIFSIMFPITILIGVYLFNYLLFYDFIFLKKFFIDYLNLLTIKLSN